MATVEEQMGAFKPLDVLTTDTFGSRQEPLPDMNAPEYKDMRSKFVEDVVKGSITSPITATADMVELGAAAPALTEEMQALFPTYTVLEKGFNDLKDAGLNRKTATELIKKATGIELGGTAGEFTGELIGLPVVAATNILAKTVQAARKHGPDAINYISTVADDARDVFRTASGGDDFDGMAPAVAGRTSQTTTPTIKTNLPDTSVSPSMIGVSTPRGQRAVKDYEDLKSYRPDISEEELFAQVGVWKGADNKYRTELSTIDAELNYEGLQKLKDNGEVELKELLDFDTLFDSYNEQYYDNLNLDFITPQSLDKLKIKVTDNPELLGGYNRPEYGFSVSNEYDVGQEYIELKLKDVTDDGILSTLLHEVQHAIQAREGFAKGSNTRMFYPDVTEAAGFGRLNFENYQEEIARLNKIINSPMRLFKKREEIASNLGRKVEARPAIDIPVTRREELLNDNSKFSLDERVLIDTVIPDILLRRLSDKQSASKKLNDPLTSSLSVDDYKITKEDIVEHLEDFSNSLFFKVDYFDTKKFDAPLEKAFASTLSDKQMKTFLDSAEKLLSNENMSPTDLRFIFDNEIYNKNRLEKLEIVIPKRAELEYRRTYGELEASLIEKRLKRRKQLNAETDMTRAEIEQQMSEEFPPLGMEIKKSIAQVNPEFMEGLIVNQGRVTVPPEKSIISEVDVLASKPIDESVDITVAGKEADALGSRQISNVEYDNVFKKLDEVETPEEWQAAAKKLVTEERDITGQSVVRRTPALEQSARDLIDNKILTREQHLENVAKNKPITEWTDLPRQPSSKAAVFALKPTQRENGLFLLSKNDAEKLGVQQTSLKEGDIFNGRLDIPAYQNYDTWVVAGTSPAVKTADGKGVTTYAKAIHYTSGDGKPVKFIASKKTSEGIGKGEQPKTGYATISGRYKATSEEDLRELAAKLLNDPEWSQVGFDPRRLGTFYLRRGTDKQDVGSVVTEADEVIQIGPLVLAKNVKVDPNYIGYNKGGAVPMKEQMSMFEDGGLMDEGGTVDPVSGNDVPPGSTQEEVRDDIPAQLSEGEFVFPADVVRFIGLGTLMRIRQEAKMGLKQMDAMGQMGNSDEATMPDDLPFDLNDLDMDDEDEYNGRQEFAVGGMPTPNPTTGVYYAPTAAQGTTGVTAPQPVQAASSKYVAPQQQAVPTATPPAAMPKYEDYIKAPEGTTPEVREYINTKTGEKMSITFINNQPTVAIPEGFVPASEYVAPETVASESSRVKTTMDEPDGREQIEKEEAMYGPGGGRISVGGNLNPDKPGMVSGATQFGVSFSGKGMGLKSPAGMVMNSLGMAMGKPIPDDARATITRDGVSVTISGTDYNKMKSENFRGKASDAIMGKWQQEKNEINKEKDLRAYKQQALEELAAKSAEEIKAEKAEQDRQMREAFKTSAAGLSGDGAGGNMDTTDPSSGGEEDVTGGGFSYGSPDDFESDLG